MKKFIVFLSIIIVVFLVFRVGILTNFNKSSVIQKDKQSQLKVYNPEKVVDSMVPIKIVVLSGDVFTVEINTVGTARSKEDYTLSAKANGQVTFLNAEIGTRVKKGALLATIEPDMADAQLKQSEANFELANSSYARQKSLAEKKLIADQQLEASETQFKVAQSALRLAKINFNNSRIVSPIDGEIAERYTDVYETTSVGKPIVRLVNNSVIEVEVGISDKNISMIKRTSPVKVKFASFPTDDFSARIINIGSQANQDNKSFPVVIQFGNYSGLIKGGMIADIGIKLESYNQAIVIPFYLVEKTTNGSYVYVEESGIAVRKNVEVGEIQGDKVRIVSGLKIGDHLIIDGYKFVSDGSPVVMGE